MATRFVFLCVIAGALGFNCTEQACGTLRCEYGNVLDANGCVTCVCLSAPKEPCPDVMCAMFCANGYELGANGCPSCVCKPAPGCVCGNTCTMVDGTSQGICQADGRTCAQNLIAPHCCSRMMCKMFCEFGNVVDEHGCPQCACKPNPNPSTCACGSPCQLPNAAPGGICARDGLCVDGALVRFSCEQICPQVMCMMYCPFGTVVDANGCSTCTCLPDPTPCVCGQSCALSSTEKGVCQVDGSCGLTLKTPCQPPCDGLMCKMYCPYGNVASTNGCPSCQCNPAPTTETCRCGETCKTADSVGICQTDGTCNALSLVKPACQNNCPPMMCMMYCEYGSMRDEVTQCPTCKCNPPPTKPCVCGQPCTSDRGNGTCQADGLTCAPLNGPKCDQVPCPAVKCALYCPNGNAVDANGCTTCRCNPAPLARCPCGTKCLQANGMGGVCQKDSTTCGPLGDNGLICPKRECPPLMCNLFCPTGNALDANGCATCSCLPDKVPCKCGETCYHHDRAGTAGMCMEDGSCEPLNARKPLCRTNVCPAVRCMMYCPGGNEIDDTGCPTCRCKRVEPCPCGAKCPLDGTTTPGICSAAGVCTKGTEQTMAEIRSRCPTCSPQLCMRFCPKGSVIDAQGCPTCKCVEDACPCGTECKTANRTAGICKVDGACVEKASGLFVDSECKSAVECPLIKCMNYCEHGTVIDAKGCATCECIAPPKEQSCPCGTKCDGGVCQADGKTCAVNVLPVECKAECPQVMCMMFCPNGNAVDENGCPSCKCNPSPQVCPCGEACMMAHGGSGVCQTDGVTCAVNIMAPACSTMTTASAATTCTPQACTTFCEYGTLVDAAGCPTCECQTSCPCGSSCMLEGGLIGSCQDDGVTCVQRIKANECMKATSSTESNAVPTSSPGGLIVVVMIVGLLIVLAMALFVYRRAQRKVAPAHNYADLTPSGYVAPQAAV